MRKFFLPVFLCVFACPLFSQTVLSDSSAAGSGHFFQKGKFDYGLNLGSEFTSASGFGSAFSTQVSPHFYYNVSKRFRIGGGITAANTGYINAKPLFGNESVHGSSGNFTTAGIFVSGQYLVNDRLTITGSAFKIFPVSRDPLPYNPFNPVSPNGAQGINFNVGYKVGKNMYIQAGFRYSEGLSPYNNSNGRYPADPFHQGSFVPGFGTTNPGW